MALTLKGFLMPTFSYIITLLLQATVLMDYWLRACVGVMP